MKPLIFLTCLGLANGAFAQTTINSQSAYQKLIGEHELNLQWLDDNSGRGNATVAEQADKMLTLKGLQQQDANNYLSIDGLITAINEQSFIFEGKIIITLDDFNQGEPCERSGTMTFLITGGRKFWRLQEIENPCDKESNLVDYVDLYFHTQAYPLKITTSPADATVRVLNIQPKYHAGIMLNEAHYHIEVSKEGYLTERRWIDLNKNQQNFDFNLSQKP